MSRLFTTLTFTHLIELSRIEDTARRAFYEFHCLKERCSYQELQRRFGGRSVRNPIVRNSFRVRTFENLLGELPELE